MTTGPRVAVVVGNPKPGSRTLAAARRVASGLVEGLVGGGSDVEPLVLDLATVGSGLLDPTDAQVNGLVEQVATADLVVVASPTYKATYTGLLKLFLDRFAPAYGTGLSGIAVPVMLGGSPAHTLAAELTLRPVLIEIGGIVPVPALYVVDAEFDDPAAYADWLDVARPIVSALLASDRPAFEGASR